MMRVSEMMYKTEMTRVSEMTHVTLPSSFHFKFLEIQRIFDKINFCSKWVDFFGIRHFRLQHFRLKHFRLRNIGLTEHSSNGTFV